MFEIKRSFRIIALLLLTLTTVISSTIMSSGEESLGITQWLVESNILENGDLSIVEDITFKFSGKYNGVFREIVLENTSGIEGIRVVENSKDKVLEYKKVEDAKKGDSNVFLAKEKNNSVILQIFSPSKNEEKTFRIIYTIKNIGKKYNDIGELYYKFLGTENDTPIDFFSVNIKLPEKDVNHKVKIFAHGPLNGEINKISDNTINLQVEDVPKDTFIEGRILFPREFIFASQNIVDKDAYSNIMNEEARLQEEIEENRIKREARGALFAKIAAIVSAIEVVIFTLLAIKTRRLTDIQQERKYLDVPEDCTPAIATYITSNTISGNTIIATILDLYRKGYVRIEDGDEFKKKQDVLKDFTITKVREEDDKLMSHERYFIGWLINDMGDGQTVTTKDIENYSKTNGSIFTKHYLEWQRRIKKDVITKGYFDNSTKKFGLPLVLLFPISLIISIVTLVYESAFGFVLLGTSVLILIQGIVLLSRKSDYGYEQYRKWLEFKKYMKKLKKDDSTDDLAKYPKDISLIYGLALGIDNDILNKFNIETNYGESTFPYGYGWMYWYFILNNDKSNVFNKSINNSFSSVTPPVGGGGGFTGGGGGGAGGGGAGGF
ncbi:DUF2207 domain-containing protein [Alkaliphilus sp. B6464]|uniref:DUF2207 domain-containing protein n=1 Tax=Alkaliphilus sp. B6464 TaxID=2731219 RepID=UPI0020116181|nr:DUF2207 domain-containing protein [Alkaliphilus sp. B6464]